MTVYSSSRIIVRMIRLQLQGRSVPRLSSDTISRDAARATR